MIVARFDFAHSDAEVDNTAIAEALAQFAGVGINGDQAGIDRRQEQTTEQAAGWAPDAGVVCARLSS